MKLADMERARQRTDRDHEWRRKVSLQAFGTRSLAHCCGMSLGQAVETSSVACHYRVLPQHGGMMWP